MNNIEYAFMAKELAQLEGRHFSKIWKTGEKSFRMKIGEQQLSLELPLRLGLAKYISPGDDGDMLVQRLRKILDNQKLASVSQYKSDRIIVFKFEKDTLIAEMFSKGNLILINADGKILANFRDESWKDREIGMGQIYKFPQSQGEPDLEKTLSEKYAIVCLMRLPLGKEYVKEMLFRCKIEEKRPGSSLSKDEISCLKKEYEKIISSLSPILFLKDGNPADYGLVDFAKNSGCEQIQAPSLSEAIEDYCRNPPAGGKSAVLEKLERRMAEQKSALATLESAEKEAKEKGDFIYSNYGKVQAVLDEAQSIGINALKEEVCSLPIVKKDGKKKEIEVEF